MQYVKHMKIAVFEDTRITSKYIRGRNVPLGVYVDRKTLVF